MIVVITGPTGVGKTQMSIEIAKYLDGIIINADAVQIYQELNIGSNKIREEEKAGIHHFLLDIKKPSEVYTVKDYQQDARNTLKEYQDRNIIFCGGTGLYINAALMDYRFYDDENNKTYDNLSNEELYELAKEKDPNTNIAKNNRVRLIRLLNKKVTTLVEPKLLYKDVLFIGLTTDRPNLYNIINKRVDTMFHAGLVQEVSNLNEKYPDSPILKRAIGYKEVIGYLNKEYSLEEVIDLIKKNSRHYAKRQYTWFNNKMPIKWFTVNYADFSKTVNQVKEYIASISKKC